MGQHQERIDRLNQVPIETVFAYFGYSIERNRVRGVKGESDFSSTHIYPSSNTAYRYSTSQSMTPLRAYSMLKYGVEEMTGGEFVELLDDMEADFIGGSSSPLPVRTIEHKPKDYSTPTSRFRSVRIEGYHPMDYYHLAMGVSGIQWYSQHYGLTRETIDEYKLGQIYVNDSYYFSGRPVPAATIPYTWLGKRELDPFGNIPVECLLNMQIRLHDVPPQGDKYKWLPVGLNPRVLFNLDSLVSSSVPTIIFEGAFKALRVQQVYRQEGKAIQAIAVNNRSNWKRMRDPDWPKKILSPSPHNRLTKPIKEVTVFLDPDADSDAIELCRLLERCGIKAYFTKSSIKPDDFFDEQFCDSLSGMGTFEFEQSFLLHRRRVVAQ